MVKTFQTILLATLAIFMSSCETKSTSDTSEGVSSEIVQDFLKDVRTLENYDGNPIVLFEEQAKSEAKKSMKIKKSTMENFLDVAKSYPYCVIIAEDHTILKITDYEDCSESGAWAICMPKAIGYIKKGELVYQDDYANNIIGIPDNQSRMAYFFE